MSRRSTLAQLALEEACTGCSGFGRLGVDPFEMQETYTPPSPAPRPTPVFSPAPSYAPTMQQLFRPVIRGAAQASVASVVEQSAPAFSSYADFLAAKARIASKELQFMRSAYDAGIRAKRSLEAVKMTKDAMSPFAWTGTKEEAQLTENAKQLEHITKKIYDASSRFNVLKNRVMPALTQLMVKAAPAVKFVGRCAPPVSIGVDLARIISSVDTVAGVRNEMNKTESEVQGCASALGTRQGVMDKKFREVQSREVLKQAYRAAIGHLERHYPLTTRFEQNGKIIVLPPAPEEVHLKALLKVDALKQRLQQLERGS